MELYAKTFRELKWVYLGELVHKVVRYVVVLEGGLSMSSGWC